MLEGLSGADVFRKVYRDLTVGSRKGAVISILTVLAMALLVLTEVIMYLKGEVRSAIAVNPRPADAMWMYFKMTFSEMTCDALDVELLDYKGHMRQTVDARVSKTAVVDGRMGHRRSVQLNDDSQKVGSGEALGLDASVPLHFDDFGTMVRSNRHTFINFYAPWCPICQKLEPIWQTFAQKVNSRHDANIVIASVNCVEEQQLCMNQFIRGIPTLRLFRNGRPLVDYGGRRTIDAFETFLASHYALESQGGGVKMPAHEGCMVQLKARVNAVPGQIYIGVKTDINELRRDQANMTHQMSWLQFGEAVPYRILRRMDLKARNGFRVLSGQRFVSDVAEQTHRHYLKLVGTIIERSNFAGQELYAYQYTASHQKDILKNHYPEVRISYDISPTVVRIHTTSQRWYEFLTKLFAIVGGFYTVMSLVDTGIGAILQRKQKDSMGKLS